MKITLDDSHIIITVFMDDSHIIITVVVIFSYFYHIVQK